MSSAILKINWQPKRMLTKSESAHHCGRSIKQFQVECPVAPTVMGNGDLRWDVRELDRWLDGLRAGAGDHDADAIIARLGT